MMFQDMQEKNKSSLKYLVLSHHKCASAWVSKILSSYCHFFSLSLYATHLTYYPSPGEQHHIHVIVNSEYDAVLDQYGDWLSDQQESRVIHIVRNPLDLVVSAYYSHLYSHPLDGWPELTIQRQKLQTMDRNSGMIATWEFLESVDFYCKGQSCGPLYALKRWQYHDSRLITIPMEKLVDQAHLIIHPSLSDLEAIPKHILDENTFEKLSGGRKKGQIVRDNHYRSGQANSWIGEISSSLAESIYNEHKDFINQYYPEVTELIELKKY